MYSFFFQAVGSENVEETTERGSEIAETFPANKTHGWALLAILLDRISFVVFILVYLFLIVRCFV
jgi:hypothetical protein